MKKPVDTDGITVTIDKDYALQCASEIIEKLNNIFEKESGCHSDNKGV